MESSTAYILLTVWTIVFLVHGINYALQIWHTPTEPGWTWASVVTGVIDIFKAQGIYLLVLYAFEIFTLENITIATAGAFACYGLPMAAGQFWKWWRGDKKSNDINKTGKFDE